MPMPCSAVRSGPVTAQREWIQSAAKQEEAAGLLLLEQDNATLRGLLELQRTGGADSIVDAAVISRQPRGWWQLLELGKGSLHGISVADAVLGPGGLVGRVQSVTPTTARVRLLTAPGSEVGVWLPRSRRHGLLVGLGTNRPQLRFIDKNLDVRAGDLVSTSPASTLLPPNVPVGVIQSVDERLFRHRRWCS